MTKFQRGDRVRVLPGKGRQSSNLYAGQLYTIIGINDDRMVMLDETIPWWNPDRFELHSRPTPRTLYGVFNVTEDCPVNNTWTTVHADAENTAKSYSHNFPGTLYAVATLTLAALSPPPSSNKLPSTTTTSTS